MKLFRKVFQMTKKSSKVEGAEVEAAPQEIPVAVIAKRPPHGFSVALNEGGKTAKYEFNSKEAMTTFLNSRVL